jgi:hypothetical protein
VFTSGFSENDGKPSFPPKPLSDFQPAIVLLSEKMTEAILPKSSSITDQKSANGGDVVPETHEDPNLRQFMSAPPEGKTDNHHHGFLPGMDFKSRGTLSSKANSPTPRTKSANRQLPSKRPNGNSPIQPFNPMAETTKSIDQVEKHSLDPYGTIRIGIAQ